MTPGKQGEMTAAGCREELWRGNPRPWIERNLKIKDEKFRLVPLIYDTSQQYYHERIFGEKGRALLGGEPFEAFNLKDRKARWTTWTTALHFAYAKNVPGFNAVKFLHDDPTAEEVGKLLDLFWENLPEEEKDPGKGQWDSHVKEFKHNPPSSVVFTTAKNRNMGRSRTFKIIDFDEMGAYEEAYEAPLMTAVRNSMTTETWILKGSTSGGPEGLFYEDFLEVKSGKTNTIYLFRPWFSRPENVLPPGHPFALVADQGWLTLTDEETALGLSQGQVRWRRWKISDALKVSYGDLNYAMGIFWQEHPERDEDSFIPLGNPEIDLTTIRRLEQQCRGRQPLEVLNISGGIQVRIWEYPQVGKQYAIGYDPAQGKKGGDKLAAQIFDKRRGVHVAELYGLTPITRFTEAICEYGMRYNKALLGIQRNGLGVSAIETARNWSPDSISLKGYPNLYHQPVKIVNNKPQPIEWGFWSNEDSNTRMLQHTRDGLTSGEIITYCLEVISDLKTFDPKKHTSDRLSAFMICQELGRNSRGELAMPVSSDQRERSEAIMVGPARAGVGFWTG